MPTINGGNAPLTRCPFPASWQYGTAIAMTANAVLTADRACIEIFMQASSSNVSAVYVGMNAAASLVLFEIPRAALTTTGAGWLMLPCPSTTVPTFYSNVDTQAVRCMWR